jgi:hypothetical protein
MFLAQRPDGIGRRPETAILPESRAALVPPHAQITCGAWPGRMARAKRLAPFSAAGFCYFRFATSTKAKPRLQSMQGSRLAHLSSPKKTAD